MATRSNILDGAMLTPNASKVCGVELRKISIGSLDLLCRISSPFANLGATANETIEYTASDISAFLYVHGADIDEVVNTVLFERDKLDERVARFTLQFDANAVNKAMAYITADAKQIQLAQAQSVPDKRPKTKNVRRLATS